METMMQSAVCLLEQAAEKFKNKTVFEDKDGSISFEELREKSRIIGSELIKRVETGRKCPVIVYLPKSIKSIISFMGSLYSASPYVPIDYAIPMARMEKTVENQERVLALEQQLQFQAKNMEAASQLYTAQRHKVHDFQAHLNTLQDLLQNQEYDAAEQYLNSVSKEQTDRSFLVNSHHAILDALFNTKATEAIQKGIDIDFELNDLSALPFDVSDMVVLFSNLLDNAIEACEKIEGDRVIRVSAVLKQSFLFSVRNTTLPVEIKNDTIQTTKPNASLHGFGLSNIKLILNKYHADFVMDYEDGWFQFTGEIEAQVRK